MVETIEARTAWHHTPIAPPLIPEQIEFRELRKRIADLEEHN
ncbi:hypothetical protein VCRA2120O333_20058 [Vibrio crassostreae]|nr:hypothetical protein VCRA2121O334_20058 [Vibrio crassostreae]CAK3853298.1 hypothetical protein VCRA2120O333_20058 [Vibrio crassostreae]